MDHSEQLSELATALAKAQGEITHARRESDNPYFKSHYADLASVWEACRGPLSRNGLSVVQIPEMTPEGQVRIHTRLLHASGQWISGDFATSPLKPGPQELGSIMTYMRRYCLSAMVGVAPEGEDDDAEKAMARTSETKSPQPRGPSKSPAKPPAAKPSPAGMSAAEFTPRLDRMRSMASFEDSSRAMKDVVARHLIGGYNDAQITEMAEAACHVGIRHATTPEQFDSVLEYIDHCDYLTPTMKTTLVNEARARRAPQA